MIVLSVLIRLRDLYEIRMLLSCFIIKFTKHNGSIQKILNCPNEERMKFKRCKAHNCHGGFDPVFDSE